MTNNNLIPKLDVPKRIVRFLLIVSVIGLITMILGLFLAPERIWPNYLIAFYYLTGLGLGAGMFVAVQYVANAGWSVALRRIPEAITATLPFAGVGAVILIFGIHTLYEWSHTTVVVGDAILQNKAAWLNEPFFIARTIGYFVLWIIMSRIIVRNSVRQDEDGDVRFTRRNVRYSVFFIITGVYTFCLASVDWLMSLQPHWYSTVFGWLNLSGMFLAALAAIIVIMVMLRHLGYSHVFTTEHLHDMGRLLMAFSFFWVYMWISQHMLIWYSNIPEETSYYIFRHFGGWGSLSFLNVILNWAIPFFLLLPKATKRSDKIMLWAAIVVLLGHWLDLYIMIMPSVFAAEPVFGFWEIGLFAGMLALFFFIVATALQKQNLVPVKDPYLIESLPEFSHQ